MIDHHYYKLVNEFEKSDQQQIKQISNNNILIRIIKTENLAADFTLQLMKKSDNSPPPISVDDFVIFSHSLKINC